jgi:hypothetical protein
MRSTTAPKPVTTPIPVHLSAPEFEACILPHLSMPRRGPKCKLGYHRVFNLILWLLYMGMPWKCLPVPTDTNGKPVIHLSLSRLWYTGSPLQGGPTYKPCHDVLYSGGAFTRLYPVNPNPTRNHAARPERWPRGRY